MGSKVSNDSGMVGGQPNLGGSVNFGGGTSVSIGVQSNPDGSKTDSVSVGAAVPSTVGTVGIKATESMSITTKNNEVTSFSSDTSITLSKSFGPVDGEVTSNTTVSANLTDHTVSVGETISTSAQTLGQKVTISEGADIDRE